MNYISCLCPSDDMDQQCIICLQQAKPIIYCSYCSNIAYYCEMCAIKFHEEVNRHHNMLLWRVSCSLYFKWAYQEY